MTQTLGERLKTLRQKLGITQEDVARARGCSKQFVSYVETGKKRVPKSWGLWQINMNKYNNFLHDLKKDLEYVKKVD